MKKIINVKRFYICECASNYVHLCLVVTIFQYFGLFALICIPSLTAAPCNRLTTSCNSLFLCYRLSK